ncbi:MAG: hypothetical protein LBH65_05845 [Desulfovibrio sp.]|nr:hypothetical protein [Desulfovibrio sp.]
MLIALTEGLPPIAEALDCDDVRGPRSFFGESAEPPRPIGAVELCDGCVLKAPTGRHACAGWSVLWRGAEAVGPGASAAAGRPGRAASPDSVESGRLAGYPLDVPSLTYLAGRSVSSFSLAWRLHQDDLLPEWGAVLCSCQTQGRGRLRRSWHSPRGNLHATFRLPADPAFRGDAAALITGLLCVLALRKLGFPLSLKWPNDLLLEGQGKVGGILLEERDGVLLAGLGLNLAERPDAASVRKDSATPAAVLLPPGGYAPGSPDAYAQSPEEPLAPFPLWRLMAAEMLLAYENAIRGKALAALFERLEGFLAWKGQRVRVVDASEPPVRGSFLGLGPGGGLSLRLDSGSLCEYFSGSLSLEP